MGMLSELERLSRHELIVRAQRLGVQRAELMTRVELTDEIVRLGESDPGERKRARGWLGIARDLVASVVEQGLHLPEAAALIRGDAGLELGQRAPAPVATVTLAEIYAAQGHLERGLKMLDQVLEKEPEHDAARGLRDRLTSERDRRVAARSEARARGLPRFPEPEPEPEEAASDAEVPAEPVLTATEALRAEELAPAAAQEELVPAEPEMAAAPVPEAPVLETPALVLPPIRDAVLLLRQAGKVLVYWELGAESRRRAEQRWPDGQAVVRVVGWRSSWEGARRADHDLELAEDSGGALVEAFGDAGVVRAILGWRAAGVVHVFAIAFELGSGAETAYELVWWPPGHRREAEKLSATATRALAHWGLAGS
jgi:hypothetical protein